MIKRNLLLGSAMFCSLASFAGTDMSVYQGNDVSVRVVEPNTKVSFVGGKISFGSDAFETSKVDSIILKHYVSVDFDGDKVTVSNPFDSVEVKVDGTSVEINSIFTAREIKYKFSGKSTNGNVIFSSLYKSKFEFNNLDLTSDGVNPPIYVLTKKKTEIHLTGVNSLKNSVNDTVEATMRGKGQFEFKGDGSLDIVSVKGHGIQSSDYVEVKSGKITINAASDGIHVNDYYLQSGGDVVIATKADGLDVGEGYAQIDGGSFSVTSDADEARGIRCTKTEKAKSGKIDINGGDVDIQLSGRGSRGMKSDDTITVDGGNVLVVMSGATLFPNKANSTYTCGIKADSVINVESGNVVVICNSDAASSRCMQGDNGINIKGGQTALYQNSTTRINSDAKKPCGVKTDKDLTVAKIGYLYIYAKTENINVKLLNVGRNVYVGGYMLDDDDFDEIDEYILAIPLDFDQYQKYIK